MRSGCTPTDFKRMEGAGLSPACQFPAHSYVRCPRCPLKYLPWPPLVRKEIGFSPIAVLLTSNALVLFGCTTPLSNKQHYVGWISMPSPTVTLALPSH